MTISRSTFEAAKQAFDEVRESRPLIEALKAEKAEILANSALKDEKLLLQADIIKLKDEQLIEKDKIIAAKNDVIATQAKQVEMAETRAIQAETKAKEAKKNNIKIAGIATVLGFILKAVAF